MCNTTAGHLAYNAKAARKKSNQGHIDHIISRIEQGADEAAEEGQFSLKHEFPVTSENIQELTANLTAMLADTDSHFQGVEVSAIQDPKIDGDHIIAVSVSWLGVPEFV